VRLYQYKKVILNVTFPTKTTLFCGRPKTLFSSLLSPFCFLLTYGMLCSSISPWNQRNVLTKKFMEYTFENWLNDRCTFLFRFDHWRELGPLSIVKITVVWRFCYHYRLQPFSSSNRLCQSELFARRAVAIKRQTEALASVEISCFLFCCCCLFFANV